MSPDINNLVVSFARSNNALAVLLFDFFDLLLSSFDFLLFFLGNDHVIYPNGNAGFGCLAEPEFLEPIEHRDGFFVSADLVTFPDQVAEFRFLDGFIWKTHFGRPNLTECDTTDCGFNNLAVRVSVLSLLTVVRIGQPDSFMGAHCTILL